jgi:hypothetical protein
MQNALINCLVLNLFSDELAYMQENPQLAVFVIYCHVYRVWLQTEFGLVIGFIEHLQIVTTCNYSAIPNSHNLRFTTALTNSSRPAVSSPVDVRSPAPEITSLPTDDPLTNLLLFYLTSQDSPLMAAGPRCIASARIAQRTPPQQLFHCCVRVFCGHYPATTVVYRAVT